MTHDHQHAPHPPVAPATAAHVQAALEESLRVLRPWADGDWTVAAGSLEWSCWETAAHIAHDLTAYAGQLAACPDDRCLPFDLVVRPGTAPKDVLRVVEAAAGMLCSALCAAAPGARAFHWGPCDPPGFAAMGVAETLLHTYDITRGLGVAWTPSPGLSETVVRRLFPDAPDGADPSAVLLWCTGRGELPGLARRSAWRWTAALPG
ncbi:hypothetical protein [Streptomyces beihaiensis]|uniref:Mycothiol-dependent maleylpyruvate isomerase metal-binding domain-containing protein n=1 Tax=Streptomyces beihaiensis TaxID=2984495 RepID=A0ABT3U403_9ACTN|nr:hypothetical protein [Streptomyces beihaiensis]MCX3064058.1 hypothetical protein [Streptomyces beihaiensis]